MKFLVIYYFSQKIYVRSLNVYLFRQKRRQIEKIEQPRLLSNPTTTSKHDKEGKYDRLRAKQQIISKSDKSNSSSRPKLNIHQFQGSNDERQAKC